MECNAHRTGMECSVSKCSADRQSGTARYIPKHDGIDSHVETAQIFLAQTSDWLQPDFPSVVRRCMPVASTKIWYSS